MREVGLAMINSVLKGYPKQVLETAHLATSVTMNEPLTP
jgi:hypothetical protein